MKLAPCDKVIPPTETSTRSTRSLTGGRRPPAPATLSAFILHIILKLLRFTIAFEGISNVIILLDVATAEEPC